KPVTADDLGAAGAMAVVLKDALKPNLIQTLEGQPVMMHCGPFANIAHGNNSLVADLIAMKLGDYVVTESGFGSDMGMEKFFDIVCRFGKLTPAAAVLVTTVRAIKHHGGVADDPIQDKIEAVATEVYGAKDVYYYPEAEAKLSQFTREGMGRYPVCMAKTHLSLSADPTLLGAPENFTLPVRDIRAYTGAGWLVPLCGDIVQMPGLGKAPAAVNIDIDAEGRTVGLF